MSLEELKKLSISTCNLAVNSVLSNECDGGDDDCVDGQDSDDDCTTAGG